MIVVTCPACRESLSCQDDRAGTPVTCAKCGHGLLVPGAPALPRLDLSPARDDRHAGEASAAPFRAGLPGAATGSWHAPELESVEPNRELYDFLAPAQEPDEIGRLGPFRVLKILGAGGMGVVYKAEDPQLKRLVALKAMLPTLAASESARKRFLREAQAAAAIVHDHIVRILQTGEDRGVPFLAMQFLEGESLEDHLKREPRLAVAEVLRIGRETAAGLAAAHQRGLMHRDIKPANLWLETRGASGGARDEKNQAPISHPSLTATAPSSLDPHLSPRAPRVKILDFGLVRAAVDDAQLTQSGAILGTPAYMAPEQAAGETVDPRCDLFSLGCILYRLSTGTMPFRGKDAISTLVAVATQNPKPPATLFPEIPRALSHLVMQLLAKARENRPESAQAVVEAIQDIEAHLADPERSASGTRRRWPWLVAGGVLGLGFGLAAILAYLFLLPSEPPTDGAAHEQHRNELTKNNLGMEFVLVPRGKAWLGGGDDKPGTKEIEIPYDFYLGKYEVTQEDWQRVMGINPSDFRDGASVPLEYLKRFPAEHLTWDEAREFMVKLNAMETRSDWVYRLPKAVEWEYACRGGPMTDQADSAFDYYLAAPTNELLSTQANFKGSKRRPTTVGSYAPNRLGLYDMHGNVWEWCDDADKAGRRMIRGGSWDSIGTALRASSGFSRAASQRSSDQGLRVARVPNSENSLTPTGNVHWHVHEVGKDGLTFTARIEATDATVINNSNKDGTYDRLPGKQFYVKLLAGTKYRITMDSKDLDSYLIVLDKDGTPFRWDNDSGGNLNALLYLEMPSDSLVKILAASVKGTGDFTLSVKETALVIPFRDADTWVLKGQELHQTDTKVGHTLLFGDPTWADYDFEVEARLLAGNECHVAFRATAPQDLLYLALGGNANTQRAVFAREAGQPKPAAPITAVAGKTEPNRWYKIRVSARANIFTIHVDGKELLKFGSGKCERGCVGVGTFDSSACFRNPKITNAAGEVLLEGWPANLLNERRKPSSEK